MNLILKLVITAIMLFIPIGFEAETITRYIVTPSLTEAKVIECDTVIATIYNKGFQTSSGIRISQKNPEKHKIIAISRDLLEKYNFGDSVYVSGTEKYDGMYYIEDLMHKRFKKRIDILINPKDGLNKFFNVKIVKVQ